MPGPARVLIWSENHVVGGSDRYLADLLAHVHGDWRVALAGNPSPAVDAWVTERLPWLAPRTTVRIASLPGSPLERARRRLGVRGVGDDYALGGEHGTAIVAEGPLARRAAVAALRYRHALTNVVRLRRLLRRARPDVLHVNNGGYPGGESCRAIVAAARLEGVPRVVHFVHNMAYPPLWPAELEQRYDAWLDGGTSTWATAAHRASDALSAARGIPRRHVRTVHYGIPEPAPAAPAGRAELGFEGGALNVAVVAAFEPRKGHAVLVDALAALRDRGVHVRAALVGTGETRAAVERGVAERGLGDRVRLAGFRRDVDTILEAADALVLPSLGNECLPYAILEAMAHGLPVVATDVAGIPEEVEHGATGLVVAPGDAAALADALAALAGDAERTARMGEAGRARRRDRFGVERMVADTLALWRGAA